MIEGANNVATNVSIGEVAAGLSNIHTDLYKRTSATSATSITDALVSMGENSNEQNKIESAQTYNYYTNVVNGLSNINTALNDSAIAKSIKQDTAYVAGDTIYYNRQIDNNMEVKYTDKIFDTTKQVLSSKGLDDIAKYYNGTFDRGLVTEIDGKFFTTLSLLSSCFDSSLHLPEKDIDYYLYIEDANITPAWQTYDAQFAANFKFYEFTYKGINPQRTYTYINEITKVPTDDFTFDGVSYSIIAYSYGVKEVTESFGENVLYKFNKYKDMLANKYISIAHPYEDLTYYTYTYILGYTVSTKQAPTNVQLYTIQSLDPGRTDTYTHYLTPYKTSGASDEDYTSFTNHYAKFDANGNLTGGYVKRKDVFGLKNNKYTYIAAKANQYNFIYQRGVQIPDSTIYNNSTSASSSSLYEDDDIISDSCLLNNYYPIYTNQFVYQLINEIGGTGDKWLTGDIKLTYGNVQKWMENNKPIWNALTYVSYQAILANNDLSSTEITFLQSTYTKEGEDFDSSVNKLETNYDKQCLFTYMSQFLPIQDTDGNITYAYTTNIINVTYTEAEDYINDNPNCIPIGYTPDTTGKGGLTLGTVYAFTTNTYYNLSDNTVDFAYNPIQYFEVAKDFYDSLSKITTDNTNIYVEAYTDIDDETDSIISDTKIENNYKFTYTLYKPKFTLNVLDGYGKYTYYNYSNASTESAFSSEDSVIENNLYNALKDIYYNSTLTKSVTYSSDSDGNKLGTDISNAHVVNFSFEGMGTDDYVDYNTEDYKWYAKNEDTGLTTYYAYTIIDSSVKHPIIITDDNVDYCKKILEDNNYIAFDTNYDGTLVYDEDTNSYVQVYSIDGNLYGDDELIGVAMPIELAYYIAEEPEAISGWTVDTLYGETYITAGNDTVDVPDAIDIAELGTKFVNDELTIEENNELIEYVYLDNEDKVSPIKVKVNLNITANTEYWETTYPYFIITENAIENASTTPLTKDAINYSGTSLSDSEIKARIDNANLILSNFYPVGFDTSNNERISAAESDSQTSFIFTINPKTITKTFTGSKLNNYATSTVTQTIEQILNCGYVYVLLKEKQITTSLATPIQLNGSGKYICHAGYPKNITLTTESNNVYIINIAFTADVAQSYQFYKDKSDLAVGAAAAVTKTAQSLKLANDLATVDGDTDTGDLGGTSNNGGGGGGSTTTTTTTTTQTNTVTIPSVVANTDSSSGDYDVNLHIAEKWFSFITKMKTASATKITVTKNSANSLGLYSYTWTFTDGTKSSTIIINKPSYTWDWTGSKVTSLTFAWINGVLRCYDNANYYHILHVVSNTANGYSITVGSASTEKYTTTTSVSTENSTVTQITDKIKIIQYSPVITITSVNCVVYSTHMTLEEKRNKLESCYRAIDNFMQFSSENIPDEIVAHYSVATLLGYDSETKTYANQYIYSNHITGTLELYKNSEDIVTYNSVPMYTYSLSYNYIFDIEYSYTTPKLTLKYEGDYHPIVISTDEGTNGMPTIQGMDLDRIPLYYNIVLNNITVSDKENNIPPSKFIYDRMLDASNESKKQNIEIPLTYSNLRSLLSKENNPFTNAYCVLLYKPSELTYKAFYDNFEFNESKTINTNIYVDDVIYGNNVINLGTGESSQYVSALSNGNNVQTFSSISFLLDKETERVVKYKDSDNNEYVLDDISVISNNYYVPDYKTLKKSVHQYIGNSHNSYNSSYIYSYEFITLPLSQILGKTSNFVLCENKVTDGNTIDSFETFDSSDLSAWGLTFRDLLSDEVTYTGLYDIMYNDDGSFNEEDDTNCSNAAKNIFYNYCIKYGRLGYTMDYTLNYIYDKVMCSEIVNSEYYEEAYNNVTSQNLFGTLSTYNLNELTALEPYIGYTDENGSVSSDTIKIFKTKESNKWTRNTSNCFTVADATNNEPNIYWGGNSDDLDFCASCGDKLDTSIEKQISNYCSDSNTSLYICDPYYVFNGFICNTGNNVFIPSDFLESTSLYLPDVANIPSSISTDSSILCSAENSNDKYINDLGIVIELEAKAFAYENEKTSNVITQEQLIKQIQFSYQTPFALSNEKIIKRTGTYTLNPAQFAYQLTYTESFSIWNNVFYNVNSNLRLTYDDYSNLYDWVKSGEKNDYNFENYKLKELSTLSEAKQLAENYNINEPDVVEINGVYYYTLHNLMSYTYVDKTNLIEQDNKYYTYLCEIMSYTANNNILASSSILSSYNTFEYVNKLQFEDQIRQQWYNEYNTLQNSYSSYEYFSYHYYNSFNKYYVSLAYVLSYAIELLGIVPRQPAKLAYNNIVDFMSNYKDVDRRSIIVTKINTNYVINNKPLYFTKYNTTLSSTIQANSTEYKFTTVNESSTTETTETEASYYFEYPKYYIDIIGRNNDVNITDESTTNDKYNTVLYTYLVNNGKYNADKNTYIFSYLLNTYHVNLYYSDILSGISNNSSNAILNNFTIKNELGIFGYYKEENNTAIYSNVINIPKEVYLIKEYGSKHYEIPIEASYILNKHNKYTDESISLFVTSDVATNKWANNIYITYESLRQSVMGMFSYIYYNNTYQVLGTIKDDYTSKYSLYNTNNIADTNEEYVTVSALNNTVVPAKITSSILTSTDNTDETPTTNLGSSGITKRYLYDYTKGKGTKAKQVKYNNIIIYDSEDATCPQTICYKFDTKGFVDGFKEVKLTIKLTEANITELFDEYAYNKKLKAFVKKEDVNKESADTYTSVTINIKDTTYFPDGGTSSSSDGSSVTSLSDGIYINMLDPSASSDTDVRYYILWEYFKKSGIYDEYKKLPLAGTSLSELTFVFEAGGSGLNIGKGKENIMFSSSLAMNTYMGGINLSDSVYTALTDGEVITNYNCTNFKDPGNEFKLSKQLKSTISIINNDGYEVNIVLSNMGVGQLVSIVGNYDLWAVTGKYQMNIEILTSQIEYNEYSEFYIYSDLYEYIGMEASNTPFELTFDNVELTYSQSRHNVYPLADNKPYTFKEATDYIDTSIAKNVLKANNNLSEKTGLLTIANNLLIGQKFKATLSVTDDGPLFIKPKDYVTYVTIGDASLITRNIKTYVTTYNTLNGKYTEWEETDKLTTYSGDDYTYYYVQFRWDYFNEYDAKINYKFTYDGIYNSSDDNANVILVKANDTDKYLQNNTPFDKTSDLFVFNDTDYTWPTVQLFTNNEVNPGESTLTLTLGENHILNISESYKEFYVTNEFLRMNFDVYVSIPENSVKYVDSSAFLDGNTKDKTEVVPDYTYNDTHTHISTYAFNKSKYEFQYDLCITDFSSAYEPNYTFANDMYIFLQGMYECTAGQADPTIYTVDYTAYNVKDEKVDKTAIINTDQTTGKKSIISKIADTICKISIKVKYTPYYTAEYNDKNKDNESNITPYDIYNSLSNVTLTIDVTLRKIHKCIYVITDNVLTYINNHSTFYSTAPSTLHTNGFGYSSQFKSSKYADSSLPRNNRGIDSKNIILANKLPTESINNYIYSTDVLKSQMVLSFVYDLWLNKNSGYNKSFILCIYNSKIAMITNKYILHDLKLHISENIVDEYFYYNLLYGNNYKDNTQINLTEDYNLKLKSFLLTTLLGEEYNGCIYDTSKDSELSKNILNELKENNKEISLDSITSLVTDTLTAEKISGTIKNYYTYDTGVISKVQSANNISTNNDESFNGVFGAKEEVHIELTLNNISAKYTATNPSATTVIYKSMLKTQVKPVGVILVKLKYNETTDNAVEYTYDNEIIIYVNKDTETEDMLKNASKKTNGTLADYNETTIEEIFSDLSNKDMVCVTVLYETYSDYVDTSSITINKLSIETNTDVARLIYPQIYTLNSSTNEFNSVGFLEDIYTYLFVPDDINKHYIESFISPKNVIENNINALSYTFVETSYVMLTKDMFTNEFEPKKDELDNIDFYNDDFYTTSDKTRYNNNDNENPYYVPSKWHIIADDIDITNSTDIILSNSILSQSVESYMTSISTSDALGVKWYDTIPEYYVLYNNMYMNIKDMMMNNMFTYIVADPSMYTADNDMYQSLYDPLENEDRIDVNVAKFLRTWKGTPSLYYKKYDFENIYVKRNNNFIHLNALTKSDIEDLLIEYDYYAPNTMKYTWSNIDLNVTYTAKLVHTNSAYYSTDYEETIKPFVTASYIYSKDPLSISNGFLQPSLVSFTTANIVHPHISYVTVSYETYFFDKYIYVDENNLIQTYTIINEPLKDIDGSLVGIIEGGKKVSLIKSYDYGTSFTIKEINYQDLFVEHSYLTYRASFPMTNDVELVSTKAKLIPASSTSIVTFDPTTGKYIPKDVILTNEYYSYTYELKTKPFVILSYTYQSGFWTCDNLWMNSYSINTAYTVLGTYIVNQTSTFSYDYNTLNNTLIEFDNSMDADFAELDTRITNMHYDLSKDLVEFTYTNAEKISYLTYAMDSRMSYQSYLLDSRLTYSTDYTNETLSYMTANIDNNITAASDANKTAIDSLSETLDSRLQTNSNVLSSDIATWDKTFKDLFKTSNITTGWSEVVPVTYAVWDRDNITGLRYQVGSLYFSDTDVNKCKKTTYLTDMETLFDLLNTGFTYTYISTYTWMDDKNTTYKTTTYNVMGLATVVSQLKDRLPTKKEFVVDLSAKMYQNQNFEPYWIGGNTYTYVIPKNVAKKCIRYAKELWDELEAQNYTQQ